MGLCPHRHVMPLAHGVLAPGPHKQRPEGEPMPDNTPKARIIDFQTDPSRYRHWKLKFDGDTAELIMDVDETAALFDGYDLKLNSYDLGVDIELADAIQRLRFEHPEVKVVVLKSGK